MIKKSDGFKQLLRYGDPRAKANQLQEGDIVRRRRDKYPRTPDGRGQGRGSRVNGRRKQPGDSKKGEPIIGAIQDFITGAYMLSHKDSFLDRVTFAQICLQMLGPETRFELPPPSILKPQMLWTGKQVFNVLMRPNKRDPVLVNLDTACREFRQSKNADQPKDLDPNDAWLVIRNSEIMCGVLDKSIIGPGKKGNIFYTMLKDFGSAVVAEAMNRISRLSARWFSNMGFSMGLTDVYPSRSLVGLKRMLVRTAFTQYDEAISQHLAEGKMSESEGFQAVEGYLSSILTKVRRQAGDECVAQLSKHNPALIMAASGAKGSSINISQMTALVGQQIIGNRRIQNGFDGRTLPHFFRDTWDPLSKEFIQNSFFTGLTPTEFFFHTGSGREGLLDTAIKTAEAGYMSRRLVKSLEDLSSQYDSTIRTSSADIVQFKYGDDSLDPEQMEGRGKPVSFERAFIHAEATNDSSRNLTSSEMVPAYEELLSDERKKFARKDLVGNPLNYNDTSDHGIDHLESTRTFLSSMLEYIETKARKTVRPNQISEQTLQSFIQHCLSKYRTAQLQPGHAVGAISAQSIGEPGTQMTLNTFHFAGVSGMSITQGVPRIKEIVNATTDIKTPVITCGLHNKTEIAAARITKGLIQRRFVGDIIKSTNEI